MLFLFKIKDILNLFKYYAESVNSLFCDLLNRTPCMGIEF